MRIGSRTAASTLGVSPRMVRKLAALGEIPGAAQIGAVWTFDVDKLNAWIESKESESCPRTSRNETEHGTSDFVVRMDVTVSGAYKQAMRDLLRGVRAKS